MYDDLDSEEEPTGWDDLPTVIDDLRLAGDYLERPNATVREIEFITRVMVTLDRRRFELQTDRWDDDTTRVACPSSHLDREQVDGDYVFCIDDDMRIWMENNINGLWRGMAPKKGDSRRFEPWKRELDIVFDKEADALMFKITWC
jgi:hypothetical protein